MSTQPSPLPQEQPGDAQPSVPIPARPDRLLPAKPGIGLTVGLCVAAALVTALLVGPLARRAPRAQPSSVGAPARTAIAADGQLTKSLRVGGTMETLNFAAIRAPKMRGPRDSGRAELTLMNLAEAGTIVEAGSVVAEFELKWLEDHIQDRQSVVIRERSNLRKRESEVLILKETERQARLTARAEFQKAVLDRGTAEVRSEIEAEILRNLAEEAQATWRQLEAEGQLMEHVHAADIRAMELQVQVEVLHVERHERDYDRLQVRTPIGGMVVRESMFNRSGKFAQSKEGDQIYPGALFMRVVDVSNMVVAASVNQVDAQSIRMGDEALVELDAYPGKQFRGRVADLGAVAVSASGGSRFMRPGRGSYIKHIPVRILLTDHDERILPDLSASADILLAERPSGVLVPREAVRIDEAGGAEYLYVRGDGGFARRDVSVGDRSYTKALIESGLRPGEEVLLGALPADSSEAS